MISCCIKNQAMLAKESNFNVVSKLLSTVKRMFELMLNLCLLSLCPL